MDSRQVLAEKQTHSVTKYDCLLIKPQVTEKIAIHAQTELDHHVHGLQRKNRTT